MKGAPNFLKKIINMLPWDRYQHQTDIPDNYTSSDVFLVSYPKSGNTFLRFLIANAIKVHFDKEVNVNWFTIQQIIPDIHISTAIRQQGPFGISSLPRIIKSHNSYNRYYKNVILLVRDPRDIMVSYFHYLRSQNRLPKQADLSQVVRDPNKGIKAWNEHTKSWLGKYRSGQNIRYYKFEDLVGNTANTLSQIMGLLGLKLSENEISEVVEICSKENMRDLEEGSRPSMAVENHDKNFVRKGKVEEGTELSPSEKTLIEQEAEEMMKKVGYIE